MVAGRIDLLLADSVAMKGGFLDTEQGKDYEFVGPDFSDPKYFGDGAGIALRKDADDLREKLNASIDAIRAHAVYTSLKHKFLDSNVYGICFVLDVLLTKPPLPPPP